MPRLSFFSRPPRSTEPPTLRAEARLSAELEGLDSPTRMERLHAALNAGEIDQAAFVRVLRYLALWDEQTALDAAMDER